MTDELLKRVLLNQIVIMAALLGIGPHDLLVRKELAEQMLHTRNILDEVDRAG